MSLEVKHLTHTYSAGSAFQATAVHDVSLTIEDGEFVCIVGHTGSGKSTLLRQLKTVLAPHGRRSGQILFDGKNLDELSQREQAEKIGFVQQSPENQIVTDKVWHELAFGLESLGYDTPTIRRRVAEMASFFGIQTWFYKSVTELSGGQKRRVAIAGVLAMKPDVLILDEPTRGIDIGAKAEIQQVVLDLASQGMGVVFISSELEEVVRLSDDIEVLKDRHKIAEIENDDTVSQATIVETIANTNVNTGKEA